MDTGEDLGIAVKDATDAGKSCDNGKMVNVIHPEYIHTIFTEHKFIAIAK